MAHRRRRGAGHIPRITGKWTVGVGESGGRHGIGGQDSLPVERRLPDAPGSSGPGAFVLAHHVARGLVPAQA
jgi:hypothetical protein